MRKQKNILDRICSKVHMDEKTGCWLFTGGKNKQGYGRIYFEGQMRLVHKVMIEQTHQINIPEDLEVNHLCYVRACCNPDHLTIVTHKRNVLLAEQYVVLRQERFRALLDASLELEFFGVARFDSPRLKSILGCRQDSGSNVVKVLKGIRDVNPGRFQFKKVGKVRHDGRGRPAHVYEIWMDESLREEISSEETTSQVVDVEIVPTLADVA
jgi:hypothetical protein